MRTTIALLLVAATAAVAGCGGGKSSSTTASASGPVTISIQIKGGKPSGGILRASAKKGEKVDLVVHSDVADEVHLHGYDLHKDVEAGGTATIRFTADTAGVFEAELESRKLQILELTVK
jgi:hypothetical protein